jgi:hypothetical protein
MGLPRVDRSRAPIFVVTVEGQPSDGDITAFLEVLSTLLAEDVRGLLVVDALRAGAPSPEQRRRMGEWMRANRAELARKSRGTAYVFPGALFRFVLSTVFLVQRPPAPYIVTGTLDEAMTWAQRQLAHGT